MKSTAGILFALLGVLLLCFYTVHSSSTAIYCEHSKGRLHCPRGQILNIISANYGRRVGVSICPRPLTKVRNCGARSSLAKVRAACQNKGSCALYASNSVFGDPCVGTYKYLQVQYHCVRRSLHSITRYVCEHSKTLIACPQNTRMHIEYANYGRRNTCTCGRPPILTTKCYSSSSNHKIRHLCHGKRACLLHASNSFFRHDPCRGTFKYIEVRYKCV